MDRAAQLSGKPHTLTITTTSAEPPFSFGVLIPAPQLCFHRRLSDIALLGQLAD